MRSFTLIIFSILALMRFDAAGQKKMDIIELSNGTSIQCKALSAAEYKRLLKGANAERIERYALHYEIDVHKVDEKTILVRENDYYTLYFSLNDLDNVLMDAASGNTGKEIMLNKNEYGSDFSANTGALIRQLCDAFECLASSPVSGTMHLS